MSNQWNFVREQDTITAEEMLRDESDFIKQSSKPRRLSPAQCDAEAQQRIVCWYGEATSDLAVIKAVGLARWAASHRRARVWATLLGLKQQGITELPL